MAGLINPISNQQDGPTTAGGTPPAPAFAAAPAQPSAPPAAQTGAPQGQPAIQPGAQQKPPIGDGPVDPDLQKKYIANCMTVVTQSLQKIAQMIQQSNDKAGALAHATILVVIRVEDSLEQSGGQLNLSMTFNGGAECLSDIVDAMEKMGVYTFSQDEINSAFLQAANQYRAIRAQQGRLDQNSFVQKLQQLKQASANGTLDQLYPGMTDYAKQAPQKAQKLQQMVSKGQKPAKKQPAKPPTNADTVPPAGSDFPPALLKKKKNQITVKPHYRAFPKKRKSPKMKPPVAGNAPMPPAPKAPKKPPNNGAM